MNWETYEDNYRKLALEKKMDDEKINENLNYAKKLYDKDLPIIYDGFHLSKLVGIHHEYLYKISNSRRSGYRRFEIAKKNSGKRIIHEPLPNLKEVQQWILYEILEKMPTSAFAKAYKKKMNIKDNVRFHKNQKIVVKLDIENFFYSLKETAVLSLFQQAGYLLDVSVLLTKLCTLNGGLPQGAPTSAYLSNLLMYDIDIDISNYCKIHSIRYTRYADDMTFSGDINVKSLIKTIKPILNARGLKLNHEKTRVMRRHNQQSVTGITVNEVIQVSAKTRRKIRQEIYHIKKYGLNSHYDRICTELPLKTYLKSLKGRVAYVLFINPKDKEMKEYSIFLNEYNVE